MILLLDTHILIWFASAQTKLSARERIALTDASQLLVSSISIWEVRAKIRAQQRRGKAVLAFHPAMALSFCETMEIKMEAASIADLVAPPLQPDSLHGDMFDQLLLVHARRLGAKLLTRDRKLIDHPLAFGPGYLWRTPTAASPPATSAASSANPVGVCPNRRIARSLSARPR